MAARTWFEILRGMETMPPPTRHPRWLVATLALVLGAGTAAACGSTTTATPADTSSADAGPSPIDEARLADAAAYVQEFGSNCMIVMQHGEVLDQHAWNGTQVDTDQEVFSITKSLTATLIGIAQDDILLDIDEPASNYLTEWRGTPHEQVTIRNLLAMDSGLYWDLQTDVVDLTVHVPDKRTFAMGLDQQHPPGAVWAYSSASAEVVGEVLERATGQSVEAFARQRLFDPLGITTTILDDAVGHDTTFTGWQASCPDLARFGQLALQRGRWEDRQLVSQEWFDEVARPSQALQTPYGLLWWHNDDGRRMDRAGAVTDDGSRFLPDAPPDTLMAVGTASQLVMVVPSHELVVVILGPGNLPNVPEVVANEVLRRLTSGAA